MKTYSPKKQDIERKWYIVDIKNKVPGRIATKIADTLRGKHKLYFAPHIDCGDYVIVINAALIKLTGNKSEQKKYYRHSGYPGALKEIPIKTLLARQPEKVIEKIVAGMIPRNRLKKEILAKLKIYAGSEHLHEAQKPELLT